MAVPDEPRSPASMWSKYQRVLILAFVSIGILALPAIILLLLLLLTVR